MTMRELSGEPSVGSSQSVHCQFGLLLCEVHLIVYVTTVSLTVPFWNEPSYLE